MPGDHVGGVRRRPSVRFVDPHPCVEVVGELLRVGDVVLVREQHVRDPAVRFDGLDHVGAPVRRVHEEAATDLGHEPEWAPNERRSLCPHSHTPGVTSHGKTSAGAGRRSTVPMERVGHASAARHIASSSSAVSG